MSRNYGGLTQGDRMEMEIEDGVALLRASYSGFLQWLHLFALATFLFPYQPVDKGVIDRVSLYGEAYRGEGGVAILRDDEDDLSDQDGASGGNKHEQGAISPRHGLFRGAGTDELAHQQ